MKPTNILVKEDSLENLDVPIFIKNSDGIYIYCNKAFVNFLGINRNEIIGHTAYDIAPKKLAELYTMADKQMLDFANNQTYDSQVQTAESKTEVRFNKSILYTSEHKIAGLIGAIDTSTKVDNSSSSRIKGLTPREIAVLELLIKGFSTKAIAISLGISRYTVGDYLKSIYLKLDVHSKNEALFKAITLFSISP